MSVTGYCHKPCECDIPVPTYEIEVVKHNGFVRLGCQKCNCLTDFWKPIMPSVNRIEYIATYNPTEAPQGVTGISMVAGDKGMRGPKGVCGYGITSRTLGRFYLWQWQLICFISRFIPYFKRWK